MAKYLMLGNYSADALKGISEKRTRAAEEEVKKCGGKIDFMYALLGDHDLVLLADFNETKNAMKASLALTELTGISFSTYPAVVLKEFDKIKASAH